MSLKSIKNLLHQKIGLNAISIGDSSIERAVKHRLSQCRMESLKDYFEHLLIDVNELNDLIEEIVVPETWFFRNNTPFEALNEYVIKSIEPKLVKNDKIRILSLPCSSGEEPYSIAISLHKAGVPLKNVQIEAADISKKALTKARRGIYGKNSFRGDDEKLKDKYFIKGGAGYRVIDKIRDVVSFKQANFLNVSLGPEPAYYDAIFCRNLMIYFDRDTQQMALDKLFRALKERGVLFVGHAETSHVDRNNFVPLYSAKTFGYVKVHSSSARKTARPSQKPGNVPEQWRSIFDQLSKINSDSKKPVLRKNQEIKDKYKTDNHRFSASQKPSDVIAPKISLISVERLATQGKYSEAVDLCRNYLKQNPESAEAYYMLGLVTDLNGSPSDADNFLRKAIYLDPNHEPALLLASLLAEKRGDIEAALSYRRRAKRVSNRNQGNSSVA